MNDERQIEPVDSAHAEPEDLELELEKAHAMLVESEAELAKEQAAVNAFRMHARLKLDILVDRYLELRAEKESLLVKLEFLRLGIDPATLLEDEDLLNDASWEEEMAEEDEPLLPTPTPGDKAAEKRLYRELARRFHPDLAGSVFEQAYRTTIMSAINIAYAEGDSEALYDLAGELTPGEAEGLARISNLKARQTSKRIKQMIRLRRRAHYQLAVLRKENTARLWRRTQALEENDHDGWSTIRNELQQAIDRREAEVGNLTIQVEKLDDFQPDE